MKFLKFEITTTKPRLSSYFFHIKLTFIYLRDTVTSKVHNAVLPASFRKPYVTFVVPTSNTDPGVFVLALRSCPPELSVALGSVQVTTAELVPIEAVTSISSGHPVITGRVLSNSLAEKI